MERHTTRKMIIMIITKTSCMAVGLRANRYCTGVGHGVVHRSMAYAKYMTEVNCRPRLIARNSSCSGYWLRIVAIAAARPLDCLVFSPRMDKLDLVCA
jgi:hypothetical protein